MALLHVSDLPPQRTEEAYALVRLGTGWSERDWRRWNDEDADGRRGMLCATALGGVLLGLAAWEVRPAGPFGASLGVPLFVAFELGLGTATRDALRAELDLIAERLGCGAVIYSEDCRGLMVPVP